MKKQAIPQTKTAPAKVKPDGLAPLIAEVRNLIQSARRGVPPPWSTRFRC